ncbi:MAG: cupin domain-containing protein [Actinobacteria bacterium]|nr:cupin domain-containing protein [Actinomycetota bacterium]
MTGPEVAALLGLAPLPHEGGMWAQTWIDEHSTAIYFLLQPGDFSAMHRLDGTELWHHYAGDPVRMLLLHPDGTVSRPVLGDDLAAGQRPCVVVPEGAWMGAATAGEWSLTGTTMAPGYTEEGFDLGVRSDLATRYPEAAAEIAALTREEPA